jgi:hypothetical protein
MTHDLVGIAMAVASRHPYGCSRGAYVREARLRLPPSA